MCATLATIAWMVSFVSSYSHTANILPDIENEDFIKDCVRIHNKFRSEVKPTASDMLYMTWDPALAQIAKAWARNCQFSHNTRLKPPHKLHPNFTSLGENIWTGSVPLFSVSSAITNWYDEIQDYDFKTRICKKVCGHYTQVLWERGRDPNPKRGFLNLRQENSGLFGQIVTKLAAQFNFALKFLALMLFPMEHILYATTDQEAITQLGHIREEPPAVPAPIMTSVWTISVLTNSEIKSNVTTLLCIQAGPYIHVTDTLLSFSLLIQ
ncbi:PREDICTED: glioma pathogenesis-related protein 1 isoform X2 [Colobus angolensis palliatus]|uniref:glioma pathogenesis-related protein 1 isoform X2 n=1 Tax=Colobus angolensis palliatus TaxID=336983 RepID=UPI0005F3949A|nr:PREDICTED: glioma pathogenesis-related protein 1 isoform X2 [Colobus angolensis palliatus]